MVVDSLIDHADQLSSEPPSISDDARDVLRLVGRTFARLIQPATTMSSLPRAKLSASAGWLKEYDQQEKRWFSTQGTRAAQYALLGGRASWELTSMVWTPRLGAASLYGHPYDFHALEWDFTDRVAVVALQEPFKIRTISISDGPATAAGSSIQKLWHKGLRSLPCFQLIGGEKVSDLASSRDWSFDRPWVSGDYKAATDGLNMGATRILFDELLAPLALDPRLRERLLVGLTGAWLDYSSTLNRFKNREGDEPWKGLPDSLFKKLKSLLPPAVRQRNGQLMGNILSFPILCLVNLSGWLLSQWRSKTTWGKVVEEWVLGDRYLLPSMLSRLPVTINGDDILFQASPEEYGVWRKCIGEFGFTLSVGKNYYSDRFFTVNSELYSRGPDDRPVRVHSPMWSAFQPNFLTMRQELRWNTGVDIMTADSRRVLPYLQSDLLSSVVEEKRGRVNAMWVKHMCNEGLLEEYSGLNWFLPCEHGGLGLDVQGLDPGYVTYAQKKLAVRTALDSAGGPTFSVTQGSLCTESETKRLRKYYASMSTVRQGEWSPDHTAIRGKLHVDLAVKKDGVELRLWQKEYQTTEQAVAHSVRVPKWLDHHVCGVSVDRTAVVQGVRRLLKWGCQISDRVVEKWFPLLCVRSHAVAKCMPSPRWVCVG